MASSRSCDRVVRLPGPALGPEQTGVRPGNAAWSPDARLLAGTLVQWQRRTLTADDVDLAERALERNGLSRRSVPRQKWEALFENMCSNMRFAMHSVRFFADLERREVTIEPGDLYPYFAPVLPGAPFAKPPV